MIPRANIIAWRGVAPWPDSGQVEQDLVISRALVELFREPVVARNLVFRGGTALHKLFFVPAGRYSEDIDLVQRNAGPIGEVAGAIRRVLDPWLGEPRHKAGAGRFTMVYRFETSFEPRRTARLKVEINTREHFDVHGVKECGFAVNNPWFSGGVNLQTYSLSELLGTKMRALYQRKKGRDLFDLWLGIGHEEVSVDDLLGVFTQYMEFGGTPVSRAQFEANMHGKMHDAAFLTDIVPLLRADVEYDPHQAWHEVHEQLISRLPGESWKGR